MQSGYENCQLMSLPSPSCWMQAEVVPTCKNAFSSRIEDLSEAGRSQGVEFASFRLCNGVRQLLNRFLHSIDAEAPSYRAQ